MEASKSISNGVAKYIKISIIESGTIKVVSNRLSIPRFSDPDRSLNRKRERFKVFEVEPRSNRGRTVMTS